MLVLTACLASLALTGLASPEDDLEAKLPEIFAKSAAHYRALDAAATPLMKVKRESEEGKSVAEGAEAWEYRTPHGWKRATGELDMRSRLWWTAGHFPGSLWYLYEATGEDFFKDRATVWTEILAPNAKVTDNHDVGFIMYCSYGNARRLLKTTKYDALLFETANSLSRRYNEKLGLIRSWGPIAETNNFLVIPDNLMNLELLEWAAGQTGVKVKGEGERRNFDAIARSHADKTMKNHFRPDGGCYHVLDYDQSPDFLGTVKSVYRGQGLGCVSAWSRGQSWAIYGYTMMFRTTGYIRYLDFAKKLAEYAVNHPNMPADGVPYWDYGAPGEERDSSAAAVMASALLELSQYVGTNPEQSNNPTIKQSNNDKKSEVVLDLTGAYDVKTLKTLTRTFVYDRAAKTFAVKDHVEFTEPTAFEDCYVTLGDEVKVKVEGEGQRPEVRGQAKVKMLAKPEELIENPGRKTPHRFAWTFEKPVTEADVEFLFGRGN